MIGFGAAGRRAGRGPLAVIAAVAVLLPLAACSGDTEPTGTGGGEAQSGLNRPIRLAINPWVGYQASAAVVKYLLEHELGYQVETKELTEPDSWKGFENGSVDIIIENWGREAEKKEYIEQKKLAVNAGPNGNIGVIGWYVPQWMAEKYPDITDWRNLNKYAHLFRTAKS